MRETIQSIQLMQFNKQYLDLFFLKQRKKIICRNELFLYPKYLWDMFANKRYSELVGRIKRRLGINNKLQMPPGRCYKEELDRDYDEGQSVVVYTAIFGNSTPINNPMFMNPNYKYVIFTDQEIPEQCLWEKMEMPLKMPCELSDAGKNRWLKLHPHILFPEYEFSVYIDGGIILMSDVLPYVASMEESFLATHVMSAPVDCVYESSKTVISAKKAPKALVIEQMDYYKKQGFPEHYGMYENGVLVRKHMDDKCIKIMDEWWDELDRFSKRDQMSLSYVLWKNHITDHDILILGNNIFRNPRFRFYDMKI